MSNEIEKVIKNIATDFFRFWWNTQGNNTEQGFDMWWEQVKDKYPLAPLSASGWVDVKDRLPTESDTCKEYFFNVLTIQVGKALPSFMKYWEIKNCPFTKYWMTIPIVEESAYPKIAEKSSGELIREDLTSQYSNSPFPAFKKFSMYEDSPTPTLSDNTLSEQPPNKIAGLEKEVQRLKEDWIPRSVAFSIANRYYGSDYNLQQSQFDNDAKELGY